MVAQKKPETKEKTRGEGPVGFGYVDVAGKDDYKRVPLNVKSVVVVDRKSNTKRTYDMSTLPAQVKDALVAFAFQTRAKTYVNNHLDTDGATVHKLTDAVYADFQAGKVYAKAEGAGKVGRVFDTALYVEAYRLTMKLMSDKKMVRQADKKPYQQLSPKAIQDLTAKLDGMLPKERTEYISKLKKSNKYFAAYVKELEAKKLSKDIEEEDIGDMF